MYISSFSIKNYKAFRDTQTVKLLPGFNILTGQNNAGKTAVLEALSFRFVSKPHISKTTKPLQSTGLNQESSIDFDYVVYRDELNDILFRPGLKFTYPAIKDIDYSPKYVLEMFFAQPSLEFKSRYTPSYDVQGRRYPSSGIYAGIRQTEEIAHEFRASTDQNGRITTEGPYRHTGNTPDLDTFVYQRLNESTYVFRAERLNVGASSISHSDILAPDASNLPSVLLNLQSIPKRFAQYTAAVRDVLPQIYEIGSRAISNNQAEIIVYLNEGDSERSDLAIPLSDCGTGIGQVLSMLYVVMTSAQPRIILIDEPNSFLHPGAVRNLISVLQMHGHHQYILTTHSATVISASEPQTLTIVRQVGTESDFVSVDPNQADALRDALHEIGASLADVFGADRILWVEGETEEKAFVIIMRHLLPHSLIGTQVVKLRSTGDLEGKQVDTVLDIYRRLCSGPNLLPPALAIIMDPEDRKPQQIEDIKRRAPEAKFLERRLFENYLLDSEAIAAVANSHEGFRPTPITPDEIVIWIESKRGEREYGPIPEGEADNWIKYVHGAKLLEHLYRDLSESRVSYHKTEDSVALTKWIVKNRPDSFKEIADLLRSVLPS